MKTVETHQGVEIRWSFLHEKYIVQGVHYATLDSARASLGIEPEPEIQATLKPVRTQDEE